MFKLYQKNTNIGESIGTVFGGMVEDHIKAFQGVGDSVTDIFKGAKDLVTGGVTYLIAGISFVFEEDKEGSWQQVILDGTHNQISYMLTNIDEVLWGLVNGIDDGVQHKGLAYSGGYVAGDVMAGYAMGQVGTSVWKWVKKGEKVEDVKKIQQTIEDLKTLHSLIIIKSVISYVHIFPKEYIGNQGPNYQKYVNSDRKMLKESVKNIKGINV